MTDWYSNYFVWQIINVESNFVGKRFARNTEFMTPSSTFLRIMWTITAGDVGIANPGEWQLIPSTEQISSPSIKPSLAPSFEPSVSPI